MYLQAWPISGAFLLRLLSPANLLPKCRCLPLLALAFPLLYRPRRFLLLQVGQNSCVVPTFVSTFSSPIPSSLAHSAFPSNLNVALPSTTIGAASLTPLPVLHQPFVVGPGFSPLPAKLVSRIVAGKFVELHELLPSNIELTEPEPQVLFDGRLV